MRELNKAGRGVRVIARDDSGDFDRACLTLALPYLHGLGHALLLRFGLPIDPIFGLLLDCLRIALAPVLPNPLHAQLAFARLVTCSPRPPPPRTTDAAAEAPSDVAADTPRSSSGSGSEFVDEGASATEGASVVGPSPPAREALRAGDGSVPSEASPAPAAGVGSPTKAAG